MFSLVLKMFILQIWWKSKRICQCVHTKYTSIKETLCLMQSCSIHLVSNIFTRKYDKHSHVITDMTFAVCNELYTARYISWPFVLDYSRTVPHSLALICVKLNISSLNKIYDHSHAHYLELCHFIYPLFHLYACVVTYSLFVNTYRHGYTCTRA